MRLQRAGRKVKGRSRYLTRSAEEGRRIREVAAELFLQWLDHDTRTPAGEAVPLVDSSRLSLHRDAASLRKSYPRGYWLNGPLIAARPGAATIGPADVDRAMEEMDAQELAAHAYGERA